MYFQLNILLHATAHIVSSTRRARALFTHIKLYCISSLIMVLQTNTMICGEISDLQRKNVGYDIDLVREEIRTIFDGPGYIVCYRHVWHITLKLQDISVPRSVVRNSMK